MEPNGQTAVSWQSAGLTHWLTGREFLGYHGHNVTSLRHQEALHQLHLNYSPTPTHTHTRTHTQPRECEDALHVSD